MRNSLVLVCIYLISSSLLAQVSTWDFEKYIKSRFLKITI